MSDSDMIHAYGVENDKAQHLLSTASSSDIYQANINAHLKSGTKQQQAVHRSTFDEIRDTIDDFNMQLLSTMKQIDTQNVEVKRLYEEQQSDMTSVNVNISKSLNVAKYKLSELQQTRDTLISTIHSMEQRLKQLPAAVVA
jgi:septal ring factor EnvC (AmiA/AmiB activator)